MMIIKVTLTSVRKRLSEYGIVIRKTEHGEFRVNFRNGKDDTAYYTTCLDDALFTGITMAKEYYGNS